MTSHPTPHQMICRLEAERPAFYQAGPTEDVLLAYSRRVRLQEIDAALAHWWTLERAARNARRQHTGWAQHT